jgi:hypothetical protein
VDPLLQLQKQGKELLNVLSTGRTSSQQIPAKVLEQHIAILGITGSGKTYTAKGIAEMLLKQRRRVCILDPTGVWWGLRSDVTGRKPGFPIYVFGGKHSDLPLSHTQGHAIAEIIGTTETSAVINTRNMTIAERTTFLADFGETLLRINTGPLNLIIDEAHLFMPQGKVYSPQSGRMLHAGNNLVSLGRGNGLRITLISQRPSKLHKDSLTQAATLIAMRMIAPHDVAAVEDWIGEWATRAQGGDVVKTLPSLDTGQGWLWAPEIGLLELTQFPRISTYDSSKAPDETTRKVVLASIDLEAIQERLNAIGEPKSKNRKKAEPEPEILQPFEVEEQESDMPMDKEGNYVDWESLYAESQRRVEELEARIERLFLARTEGQSAKPATREERQPIRSSNGHLSEELWSAIKARITKDPVCLKIMATEPEIQFEVTKRTIEVDGDSLRGNIARLITEGFFDNPTAGNAAFNELQKRGVSVAKPSVYRECDALTTLGFFYKLSDGYQVVSGMKRNVVRR